MEYVLYNIEVIVEIIFHILLNKVHKAVNGLNKLNKIYLLNYFFINQHIILFKHLKIIKYLKHINIKI